MSEKKYLLISPARNEENHIETTIKSVLSQTIRPVQWIIVDDGSTDNTKSIVQKYASEYGWIKLIGCSDRGFFEPGRGVIKAFNAGYSSIDHIKYDFVVKLDCDLLFSPDYFEKVLSEFDADEKLGIASGIYFERRGGDWVPIKMPYYHTAGASKIIRRECFERIGGFIEHVGWDTIDEIRARLAGWDTRHFKDYYIYHLKSEGSNIGKLRTSMMLGEIYYLTGGSKLFFVFKVIERLLFVHPFFRSGLMLLCGYLKPWLKRKQLLVSDDEARYYKRLLNRRLLDGVKAIAQLKKA